VFLLSPTQLEDSWADPASSHCFGVGQALELARALGALPAWVQVIAIEASGASAEALSPAAKAAVPRAVRLIRDLLRSTQFGCST
jgi:Ni,Fe-hydrogenase maturation factor